MNKKKKQMYMIAIFSLALVIGIGYAILNSTLNITGNTKIKENSWDVHFENFSPKSGSVTATSAGIDTNKTSVNYTVTLSKPGDFYEFTVDAVNKGSIDAMINTVSNTGLTAAQKKYMTYSATYEDGTEVAEKQKLDAETGKETIKVRLEYKKDISAGDLPSSDQTVSLTFSVNYVQADGSAVVVNHPVCKRATTLHNDGTNTYGSLGTAGTLTAGDAFDCDVNGDGTYNAENERFYYVSGLDTNNDYAVLIYYNNVSGGNPNNTNAYAYDANAVSGVNYNGPQTAKTQLPTTSQWQNISLYSTTRNITDEAGTVKVSNFSYSGYAARLLTYQEAVSACGSGTPTSSGYLNNCKYLLENTCFSSGSYIRGYWTETVRSSSAYYSVPIDGSKIAMAGDVEHANGIWHYGVRPAIEVPVSKIQK